MSVGKSRIVRRFFLLACLLVAGCAAPRVSAPPEAERQEVMGPVIPSGQVEEEVVTPDAYGPSFSPGEAPAATAASTETSTSTATSVAVPPPPPSEPRLCVVLGPGMAKAMAEAAVLESIKRAGIPVHCVVGAEMGAIVGALYSFSGGNTNSLQWQLFKITKDQYLNFPMISLRDPRSSGRRLNDLLRGFFQGARIETLPIRFATLAVDDESDAQVELDHGSLVDALSASAAVAGVFEPWKIGRQTYRSAALTDPAPIELARKLGGNFIVLVDVLLGGSSAGKSRLHRVMAPARSLVRLQKRDASFVIQVNADSIAFDDFARKGEILSAGSAAAEKAVPELKAVWEKWLAGPR